MLHRHHWR